MEQGESLSTAEFGLFLSSVSLRLQAIALKLRSLILTCCPGVTERLLWGGLSYHDRAKGGPVRGAICQIELYEDHIRLSFIHGVRLADPCSLLRGDRKSKRYLKIVSDEDAPWEAIRDLIEAASRLDPSSFEDL